MLTQSTSHPLLPSERKILFYAQKYNIPVQRGKIFLVTLKPMAKLTLISEQTDFLADLLDTFSGSSPAVTTQVNQLLEQCSPEIRPGGVVYFQVLGYEPSANARFSFLGHGLQSINFTRIYLHQSYASACFSISSLLLCFWELNPEVPSQCFLSKVVFKDFSETIMSRAVCFSERLRIYVMKSWNYPLLFWWVGFPELFSLLSCQILSFKLVVSSGWLIFISAFNILY